MVTNFGNIDWASGKVNSLDESSKELVKLNFSLSKAIKSLDEVRRVQYGISSLVGLLSKIYSPIDELNRSFLSIGKNLIDVSIKNSKLVDDLHVGGIIPLQAKFDLMRLGLDSNTNEVVKLASYQKVTNQENAKLFQLMGASVSLGGLTITQMNNLAKEIFEAAKSYGKMSSDLINAVNKLGNRFGEFNFLGITSQITGAVSNLTSRLGPAFTGPLTTAINLFTDTSIEGNKRAGLLGIALERNKLLYAKTSSEASKIILSMVEKSGKIMSQMQSAYGRSFIGTGKMGEIFGKGAIDSILQLNTAIVNGTLAIKKNSTDNNEHLKSLMVIFEEFKKPIIQLAINTLPVLTSVIKFLSNKVLLLSGIMAGWLVESRIRRLKSFKEGIGFLGILGGFAKSLPWIGPVIGIALALLSGPISSLFGGGGTQERIANATEESLKLQKKELETVPQITYSPLATILNKVLLENAKMEELQRENIRLKEQMEDFMDRRESVKIDLSKQVVNGLTQVNSSIKGIARSNSPSEYY